jgi:hypothetical protein
VNTPLAAGNTLGVIRSASVTLALSALALLAGCAGPARAPGPPGETLILLENRVTGPCQLTWVSARVDERPLSLVTITPPGEKPATLDRPVLSPGQHVISVSATASCGASEGERPAVLQASQPVYMGREGGKITVSLAASATSSLEASFAVAGGHVLAPRADGGDIDCRSRQPMDRAICRTEAALARAHERRDVVLVLCVSDKLKEMRLVAGTAGSPSSRPAPGDGALGDIQSDAAKRVIELATEADYCIGQEGVGEGGMRAPAAPANGVSALR